MKAHLFRTIILERLRLPLLITDARCECSGPVPDPLDCDPELSHRSAPRPEFAGRRRHNEVQRFRDMNVVCMPLMHGRLRFWRQGWR